MVIGFQDGGFWLMEIANVEGIAVMSHG